SAATGDRVKRGSVSLVGGTIASTMKTLPTATNGIAFEAMVDPNDTAHQPHHTTSAADHAIAFVAAAGPCSSRHPRCTRNRTRNNAPRYLLAKPGPPNDARIPSTTRVARSLPPRRLAGATRQLLRSYLTNHTRVAISGTTSTTHRRGAAREQAAYTMAAASTATPALDEINANRIAARSPKSALRSSCWRAYAAPTAAIAERMKPRSDGIN